jgi:hypothetical protein
LAAWQATLFDLQRQAFKVWCGGRLILDPLAIWGARCCTACKPMASRNGHPCLRQSPSPQRRELGDGLMAPLRQASVIKEALGRQDPLEPATSVLQFVLHFAAASRETAMFQNCHRHGNAPVQCEPCRVQGTIEDEAESLSLTAVIR